MKIGGVACHGNRKVHNLLPNSPPLFGDWPRVGVTDIPFDLKAHTDVRGLTGLKRHQTVVLRQPLDIFSIMVELA